MQVNKEVVNENATMKSSKIMVKKDHIYLDSRTFFQGNWISSPDAGHDMPLGHVRGVENAFVISHGRPKLVICSPAIPTSSLTSVEES